MNETLKTALATALTAATEALEAAQPGQLTEARQLLTIVDEQLALGEGGDAGRRRSPREDPAPAGRGPRR